jgi:hypothetical protein
MTEEESHRLQEHKLDLEVEMRGREMALKENVANRKGLTAAQATIAGAVIALVSGVAGALIAAWSSQSVEKEKSLRSLDLEKSKQLASESLERKKFETSLILEAIKTPSRADAIRNLKFFVAAGFVSDPDGKIARLQDESLPSISSPSPESASRALEATGIISYPMGGALAGHTSLCTAVALNPQQVVTANFCGAQTGDQNVIFTLAGKTYPLRLVTQQEQSKLALFQVDSNNTLGSFLDTSRIRDPSPGERIYFATARSDTHGGQDLFELKICNVTSSNLPDINNFEHDCSAEPGSAGAVIIAVTDDALLGINYAYQSVGDSKVGIAAKLSMALAGLRTYLNPSAQLH